MFQIKGLNQKENGTYRSVSEMEVRVGHETDLRQISLTDSECFSEIRALEGLCTRRFYADIETERLDYTSLSVGNILSIDHVQLQITSKGKRCFDECPIRKTGKRCSLPKRVVFARVLHGGTLKIHASGTKTF